jgi:hypothetical protein
LRISSTGFSLAIALNVEIGLQLILITIMIKRWVIQLLLGLNASLN